MGMSREDTEALLFGLAKMAESFVGSSNRRLSEDRRYERDQNMEDWRWRRFQRLSQNDRDRAARADAKTAAKTTPYQDWGAAVADAPVPVRKALVRLGVDPSNAKTSAELAEMLRRVEAGLKEPDVADFLSKNPADMNALYNESNKDLRAKKAALESIRAYIMKVEESKRAPSGSTGIYGTGGQGVQGTPTGTSVPQSPTQPAQPSGKPFNLGEGIESLYQKMMEARKQTEAQGGWVPPTEAQPTKKEPSALDKLRGGGGGGMAMMPQQPPLDPVAFSQMPQGPNTTPFDQTLMSSMARNYNIIKGRIPATPEQVDLAFQWFAKYTPMGDIPMDIASPV